MQNGCERCERRRGLLRPPRDAIRSIVPQAQRTGPVADGSEAGLLCRNYSLFAVSPPSPACATKLSKIGTASLIRRQQKLSMALFVLWSNSSSQNSGTRSRSDSGPRTMRISQPATETSETEASGLSSGMDERRTYACAIFNSVSVLSDLLQLVKISILKCVLKALADGRERECTNGAASISKCSASNGP